MFLLPGTALPLSAQTNQSIYTDALQNGWQDWGWASLDYASTNTVHSGTRAVRVTITAAWQAMYVHHAPFHSSGYTNLTFWIHGGASGGQQLRVQALLNGAEQPSVNLPALPANTWQQVTLSLESLGVANQPDLDGFWIADRLGAAQPAFFVDDIVLAGGTPPPPVTNSAAVITVDASRDLLPISPLIYGVAFASSNDVWNLNVPLNRSGGNTTTRYNWQNNAANRAADWYFESLEGGTNVAGGDADSFVRETKGGGAQPMLTVPMIGWVAKLGPGGQRLASYSIAKYGPQQDNDWEWFPDAGNGVTSAGVEITWNDRTDANVLTDSTFWHEWIRHLTNRWGLSTNGGVRYYCMDNEHGLWHSTHRDVHPVGATMREVRDKFFDYGAKVKAVDPGAQIVAPEEWGWLGYLYSGYDNQWAGANGNWNPANFPDRSTNGGWDYLPWFLDQARQRELATGRRLLDVFTVHYYPQGGEFGNNTSTSVQLLRNRSTRSLWDTNYVDETWINSVIKLMPRLKGWVTNHYPGTKIGITEYNWGAEHHINGATALADVLGIFGREGLDLATYWTTPPPGSPAYNAIRMYRNYDGSKSTFGETSVKTWGPNPDNVSAFGALKATNGSLTLMVINKQLGVSQPVSIVLSNFVSSGSAQVWRLTAANAISNLGSVVFSGNTLSNVLPAQSITLFVIGGDMRPTLRAGPMSGGTLNLWLEGQAGQRYVLQSSSNLANWIPLQTNTLASNSLPLMLITTNASQRFYRARWTP